MKKQYHLTPEGIAELTTEQTELVAKRNQLAEALNVARDQGDLSENADYQTAYEELQVVETRLREVEHILANVEEIKKPVDDKRVRLGSRIKLKNDGKTIEFQVVGSYEADPLEGKISDESPIGKALMGKHEGDSVDVETPAETVSYKIVDIS